MSPATAIWIRIVVPDDPTLTPDVARHFLSGHLTEEEKARYQSLASKDQVDLNMAEWSELEALVHVSTAMAPLQSKARLSLKKRQPAA